MNQQEHNPALSHKMADNSPDYSEMFRTQEVKQLNKRLRKTRIVLWICAAALIIGAAIFWNLPESSFTTNNFFIYMALATVIVLLSAYSNKQPYYSILTALIICIVFWGFELVLKLSEDLLIEGSIQKLFIISLLVSCFHASKEAELIRKELHFS
jgi:hypothetical protein